LLGEQAFHGGRGDVLAAAVMIISFFRP